MASGYNVRVGDADREAIAAQLREHYADGRLTLEELNERLDQAFAAKTKADLNTVMRDLPQATRPGAGLPYVGAGQPGPGWYGPVSPGPGRQYGQGGWDGGRSRGPGGAFAPMLGLVWLLVILGSVLMFGLGGGDRPIAIVLFLAALALVRRLFGLGRGRGRGPRGPRGPRGRRR
ncbi:MAG TPA: DUF1707 domain-containing protein [Streptosporangiaceae bacterium]|nr:DUF1707 domain-containing protein [Streptosporangiaceae bacterium]HEX5292638.1 DUF1707 domain-containing protein [Streptosporangiaceae bacterium]